MTTRTPTATEPTETRRHEGFVLSRPHGTVSATRWSSHYIDARDAVSALRSGTAEVIVGAIPFAHGDRCALYSADSVSSAPGHWTQQHGQIDLPQLQVSQLRETEHLDRVNTALGLLRAPDAELRKVVLARTLELSSDFDVDPLDVLASLVAGNKSGNGYYVDLSAAGGRYQGRALVGSSPEVLIRRQGRTVTCHPLAGSAARHADPERDHASGMQLSESSKDRREHAFVVDAIREALAPLCTQLDVPTEPSLTSTPQLWHLGTPIRGELASPDTTALDLALALHPTPAVCGTPTALAYETIDELEGERGFYAGTVGWCSADGDGEWMVAIRCVEISSDRRRVTAYAGGGIVAESDPEAELRETVTKFGTVMAALGVAL